MIGPTLEEFFWRNGIFITLKLNHTPKDKENTVPVVLHRKAVSVTGTGLLRLVIRSTVTWGQINKMFFLILSILTGNIPISQSKCISK